ncbi:MAG: S24/S26 family peptidase [Ruminococcus sp.]|nr:S24/S26 family peptidase [Ruminococcus sp.]
MKNGMSYEEYLEKHGTLTYTNVGVSMLPLLRQGRDLFTVKKKGSKRCRRGDVVLYRRPPDKYVLHRVIETRPEDYVILGDNCVKKEYGIRDSDIIGVMIGYVRNGKERSVNFLPYRLYSGFILCTVGPRTLLKRIKMRTRSAVKRIVYGKK